MSVTRLLKQTYWMTDDEEMVTEKLKRAVAAVRNRTFNVTVEIKRYQKSRSPEAEGYLRGVCYPLISSATGNEKDDIHGAMLHKYFGTKVIECMGVKLQVPVRTTTINEEGEKDPLSAKDFWDFTDFVIREAAMNYDVVIPPPDPEKRKH